jgi:molybdopterin synthase catalytic subunit
MTREREENIMKNIRTAGVLLALVCVTAAGAARGQEPAGERSVVARVAALEEVRRAAMVAADTTALRAGMSRDATYVHSTGLVQTRDELCAVIARGDIRYRAFSVDGVAYRAYESTVVATGVQRIDLESGGRPLTSRSRFTVVYVLDADRPRLVAYQSTPLPEIVTQEKR